MVPGMGGRSVTRVLARNQLLGVSPEEFLVLSAEAYREEYRLSARVADYLVGHRQTLVQENQPFEERLERLGDTAYLYTGNPARATELAGHGDLRILRRAANLEDVFLKLTGRDLRD